MQIVTIVEVEEYLENQDKNTWRHYEVEDIRPFLMEQFPEWPETARIYHKEVSQIHDVTPVCKEDVERLGELEGPFYVIVFPGDPITWSFIAIVVVALIVGVVMVMMMPPLPTMRNTNSESPNNELSQRVNKARPMARIPDIYGQVWSTPDLLSMYTKFENHQEVEYSYMCIGRGSYEIAASGSTYDIRDDSTLINDIGGTSVEVYGPDTSPNSGDVAEITIGDPIATLVYNVKRFTAVNGQVLRPPNDDAVTGNSDIWFSDPNEINCEISSDIDFTEYFEVGDQLTISKASSYVSYSIETESITADTDGSISFSIPSGAIPSPWAAGLPVDVSGASFTDGDEEYNLDGYYVIDSLDVVGTGPWELHVVFIDPASVNSEWDELTGEVGPVDVEFIIPDGAKEYDLDGTYEISTCSKRLITLVDPASTNADWSLLAGMTDGKTENISPILSVNGLKWIGPFTLDTSDMVGVLCNFIAQNGLFKDNGENQRGFKVRVRTELTPVDSSGTPTGAAETFGVSIIGSATSRSLRAATRYCNPGFTGLCEVRAARLTEKAKMYQGQAVDEIKWRDVYTFSPTGKTDFGDVTTVQAKTIATTGATAIKERKLRALVTRKLPSRVSGSTFTTELTATTNAADIISAICLDEFIGRRSVDEIDFDSIYDLAGTGEEISTYFGTDIACEFNYTFDSDNLSFEETIQSVTTAIHCLAYRRGNIIKLSFEKETDDSTLLFSHRNKLPGTETRTQSFGYYKDYDGIEYQWVDPEDDAVVTMYLPTNRNFANPQKIESVGIRNRLQAYMHMHRAWNKIRYQNLVTEFEACSEASLLVINDRILVADNTRTGTQDGEVKDQDVLTLTLSQPVTFTSGVSYTIFLQLTDKTIDSIPITAGSSDYEVILSRAPLIPLVYDDDTYARTTYMIVGDDDTREKAFLVMEKEPQGNFTFIIRATNYDSRYYANDDDYIDGVIDIDGNVV